MKKYVLVCVLLIASLVILAACGSNDNGGNGGNDVVVSPDSPPVAPPADTSTADAAPPVVVPTDVQITLRYANWNVGTEEENNLERRMIQAFMDEHPNITIEIDESIVHPWTEALTVAASIGNLPDVFMVNDTGMMAANGWLLDITSMSNGDSDFTSLPAAIREATQIGNVVYTVPFAQFMMGYFVNRTLFEEFNLDPPEFGVSTDDFVSLIRQVTDLNRPSIGLTYANQFLYWLPASRNSNFGFFGYDGTAYVLNSPEMIEAINLAAELTATGMTYGGLDYDLRQEIFPMPWAGGNFNQGHVGVAWDGTWAIGHLPRYAAENNFDLDFIGVPGGNTIVTLDILGIASTTEHPEAAYLFARWMGHGVEGYLRRVEIAQANGLTVNGMPLSTNTRVLDAFWNIMGDAATLPGMRAAVNSLDTALIDGNKIVPGFVQGRFYAPTGISIPGTDYDNATVNQVIHFSILGNLNFADHADAVNNASRAAVQAARDAIN